MANNKLDLNGRTAVVVNDDVTQLAIFSGLLSGMGMKVKSYSDAGEALEEMGRSKPPHIIVTDLYMPEIDGWRFCRLLRSPEYKAYNQIPILVVSATFSGEEASRITSDLCANAFLSSPVDGKHFRDMVKSLIAGDQPIERLRVLVVEDDKILAGTLGRFFETHGCLVDIAHDKREASETLSRTSFDLAVIDYHLPDGEGDSLLMYFQEIQPYCVLIMMTSDSNPELALTWMRAGAAAYLRKPFAPEYLLELCAKARRERALLRVEDLLEERTRELRNSETLHRTTVDSLSEAIHLVDRKLRVILFNERFRNWCKELKIAKEAKGKLLKDVFPFLPEDIFDQYRCVFENGVSLITEEKTEIKGQSIITETKKIPVMANGVVKNVLTIVKDITKRKQTEGALLQSEEKYRQLFLAENDAIFLIQKSTGKILEANNSACALYDYPIGEMLSLKNIDLSAEPEETEKLTKLFQERIPLRYHKKKNGTIFPVEITASQFQLNDQAVIIAAIRDVTARQNQEEQIKASLKEKEVLLKEIHHRVKNNMQAVNSLLNLQAKKEKNERVVAALREGRQPD